MKKLILLALSFTIIQPAFATDCHWRDSLNGTYRYHTPTSFGSLVFTPGDFYTKTNVSIASGKAKRSTERGVVDIDPVSCVAKLTPIYRNSNWVIWLTSVDPITKLAYSGEFIGGSMTRVLGTIK